MVSADVETQCLFIYHLHTPRLPPSLISLRFLWTFSTMFQYLLTRHLHSPSSVLSFPNKPYGFSLWTLSTMFTYLQPPYPLPPFSPSLISLKVSVDVQHHVYFTFGLIAVPPGCVCPSQVIRCVRVKPGAGPLGCCWPAPSRNPGVSAGHGSLNRRLPVRFADYSTHFISLTALTRHRVSSDRESHHGFGHCWCGLCNTSHSPHH